MRIGTALFDLLSVEENTHFYISFYLLACFSSCQPEKCSQKGGECLHRDLRYPAEKVLHFCALCSVTERTDRRTDRETDR